LTVTHQAAGRWRHDPSNLVVHDRCQARFGQPVSWMLRNFPRGAFDYLWLINPPPHDPALVADMQKLWGLPDGSALYRIGPQAAKPAP
jgi:hypothetical protein